MKRRSTLFHADGERGLRGGERQLLYLAAALRARGRRNVVYCRAESELQFAATAQGFETRQLSWRILSDARREDALIHAHTGRTASWALPAQVARIPFIAHRRVDFRVGAVAAMLKYRRAGRVIAVSRAIAAILRTSGVPASQIAVVADGLPVTAQEAAWAQLQPDCFSPADDTLKARCRRELADAYGIDPTATWIGNLAALVAHKDHATLLAAAAIVLARFPNSRFLIAGRGPEEERLQKLHDRLALRGKVYFLGHRPDALNVIKSLDVYVQSSWGEGLGSVLIEAAACGVPIAATTAGGIAEIVENESTGLLVPPRNSKALAAAIMTLCADRPRAHSLAAEALRRLPRFGLAPMADSMETIYDSLS